MTYRPALTTGRIAQLINTVLAATVYDDRSIRAEIDADRLRAFAVGRGARRRVRRVTEAEFLRWAASVLRPEELQRLESALAPPTPPASSEETGRS